MLGGGGFLRDASALFTSCTISGHVARAGGGIHVRAPLSDAHLVATLRKSIVARNTAPNLQTSVGDVGDRSATNTSLGHNLTDDDASFLDQPSDLVETDPRLGPLQNNGGAAATHMPLGGSPALDRGNSGSIARDQRGQPRRYDIPAVPRPRLACWASQLSKRAAAWSA